MQQPSDIRSLIAHSLRENAMPLALVLAHLTAVAAAATAFGFGFRMAPWFNLLLFASCYMLIFAVPFLWLLAKERPDSPVRLATEIPGRWRFKERFILAAPMLLATASFLPAFSSIKSAIPAMNPYALDPMFARMDVWIHGRHAWEVLHPLIGYPPISFLLNGIYHLWIGAFYASFCAVACWVEQPELRRRFLISFLLCWALLGNLAAIFLSSVGPCFYGLFYPNDPYVGLMDYLRQADQVYPLAALDVQQKLINWWNAGVPGLGRGISAMPSLHVSIACLLMLLSWQLGRIVAWGGTLFLVAIFLGSIHLGYHYAVDAYFSLIATPAIWWASRHLAAVRLFPLAKLAPSAA
jgi:hypothetical protein